MPKYKYTFDNGDVVTSNLKSDELVKRMQRLDRIRVLLEGYEEGPGLSIYNKALRAYHKTDGFTGIIRLTRDEKDWLWYQLEREFLSDQDKEWIEWYIHH